MNQSDHFSLVAKNANQITFRAEWDMNINGRELTWRDIANYYRRYDGVKFKGYSFADVTKGSVCGSLKTINGRSIVGYNLCMPENRQHFTLMHEIYHYQVHAHQGTTGEHFSDLMNNSGYDCNELIREQEANLGAGMMMLNDTALKYWVNSRKTSFNTVAKHFEMSKGALYNRLVRYVQFNCHSEYNHAVVQVQDYQRMSGFQCVKSFKGFY